MPESAPLTDAQWWELLLDGQPHTVNLLHCGYESDRTFMSACYRKAKAAKLEATVWATKRMYPAALVVARRSHTDPGLEQVTSLDGVHQMPPRLPFQQRRFAKHGPLPTPDAPETGPDARTQALALFPVDEAAIRASVAPYVGQERPTWQQWAQGLGIDLGVLTGADVAQLQELYLGFEEQYQYTQDPEYALCVCTRYPDCGPECPSWSAEERTEVSPAVQAQPLVAEPASVPALPGS
jgi:hypothetical protein